MSAKRLRLPRRRSLIWAAVAGVALVIVLRAALDGGGLRAGFPAVREARATRAPIAAEADGFRTRDFELGIAPAVAPAQGAHPRTLSMYRRLRAFPGAPPRIPHGLTTDESTSSSCNACHLRGGWVARFGAYAPVTPHPDDASCLQCHVPLDELVGRPFPLPGNASTCAQCHIDPDARRATFGRLDWRPAAWPDVQGPTTQEAPVPIPHALQGRGNCLACHAGPGAVIELRTDHPDRINCRQCHVESVPHIGPTTDSDDFAPRTGGRP